MRKRLATIDRGLAGIEARMAALLLMVLVCVLGLDIVHRNAAQVLASVARGGSDGASAMARVAVAATAAFVVAAAAMVARKRARTRLAVIMGASVTTAAALALACGLAWLLPHGFSWAAPLGLAVTLVVGFVGASLCTHDARHIPAAAFARALPLRWRLHARAWGGTLSAWVVAAWTLVSARDAAVFFAHWRATEGYGGVLVGVGMPTFVIALALALLLAVVSARLMGQALRDFSSRAKVVHALTALLMMVGMLVGARAPAWAPFAVGLAILTLVALLLAGAPLFVVMAVLSAACLTWGGNTISTLAVDIFPAMALRMLTAQAWLPIALFVVAGAVMAEGALATRMLACARVVFAGFPGGFVVVAVVACMFFAAVSGSSPVTLLAMGPIMLPALVREGHCERVSLGLLTAAGSLGMLIPPSIPMLVYALATAGVRPIDVSELFVAGVGPGLCIGALLAVAGSWMSARTRGTAPPPVVRPPVWPTLRASVWALLMPVVVLGGMLGGWFTITEAATVAAVYAMVVELFIHRSLPPSKLVAVLRSAAVIMGALLILIVPALALNYFMVDVRMPDALAQWVAARALSKVTLLLAINALLLLAGACMDAISAIVVFAPLLVPLAVSVGMDPLHLGIVVMVNLEIGYLTPPIGLNLFVASSAFGKSLGQVVRAVWPFVVVMLVALAAITFVPAISLGLVHLQRAQRSSAHTDPHVPIESLSDLMHRTQARIEPE